MTKALAGLRILDLTTVLMGPFATQMLGDLGADVIKVEPPHGDPIRRLGPSRNSAMGPIFLHTNRNKRSISLDLKSLEGRDALLELCARADAFVFNVRPQSMDRLGLSYDVVRERNPSIVYAGLVGYGAGGAYSDRPAYDDLIQGAVALPWLMQTTDGSEPRYVPMTIADYFVGVSAAANILAALLYRERSGCGQQLEIPMFETMAQLTLGQHLGGETFDPPVGAAGYQRLLAKDRRPFRTRDGHICALVYSDRDCKALFTRLDRLVEYETDSRFNTYTSRGKHAREFYEWLSKIFLERTTKEWMTLLLEEDIPVMPMNTLDTLFDDPHLENVGFLQWLDHPTEGRIRSIRNPARWSATPPESLRLAPHLGEHTEEVLREAGISAERIKFLTDRDSVAPAR